MKEKQIIVVEDNATMRLALVESLRRDGYQVSDFDNGPQALTFFNTKPVPLVITDLKMEPMEGSELLQKIKEQAPDTEVLIISAYGTVDSAVKAMQSGAVDFLTKPFSAEELRIRVGKVWEKIQQRREVEYLREENLRLQQDLAEPYQEIVGESAPMKRLLQMAKRVAGQESTVLIQGESGTGKELIARYIHRHSQRASQPFVRVNCGALNDNLLESELFGHEKGAFTGAHKRRRGRFELADSGTLFLDEIGDISPAMQIKLLRVLQEKEFERLGGETTISVDVRILAATNRDLHHLLSEGKFREDLYYRISVIPLQIPSLRERKSDIPLLVNHFLGRLARPGQPVRIIPAKGMALLQEYAWPGNIRELENVVERLWVLSAGEEIDPGIIGRQLGDHAAQAAALENQPLPQAVEAFEKHLIIHALKRSNGIKNRAAKLLGIGTSALYYKLEKYGLIE